MTSALRNFPVTKLAEPAHSSRALDELSINTLRFLAVDEVRNRQFRISRAAPRCRHHALCPLDADPTAQPAGSVLAEPRQGGSVWKLAGGEAQGGSYNRRWLDYARLCRVCSRSSARRQSGLRAKSWCKPHRCGRAARRVHGRVLGIKLYRRESLRVPSTMERRFC